MQADNVKLFVQPDKCGCVIASIAMVTGENYHDISGKYIAHDLNRQGYNTECQNKILNDLGYSTCVTKDRPRPISNTMYILTVDSLNYKKSWHALVYIVKSDGTHHVLDPNNGHDGHLYYTLEMIQNIDPKKYHDCVRVWKSNKVMNQGVSSSKKLFNNNVKPFTKDDCKKCTYGKVINDNPMKYLVSGGSSLYGSDELF